jgi:hypothetical protein
MGQLMSTLVKLVQRAITGRGELARICRPPYTAGTAFAVARYLVRA